MKHLLFMIIIPFLIACVSSSNKLEHSLDKEIMDLEYLVREPNDLKSQAPVLILLHGYGSNENDLFSIASEIPGNWLVVSVRAPFTLAENQFKWYDAKLVNEKITMNFEDEEKSRKMLLSFIDQIVLKYKADKNKVVTAGFSQGANMSLGLLLTEPGKIRATGCFSGRFMEEIKPLVKNKKALKDKNVFIAHGTEDQMLPMRYAEENIEILEGLGIKTKLSTDRVAHTISEKQLNEFIEWMKAL